MIGTVPTAEPLGATLQPLVGKRILITGGGGFLGGGIRRRLATLGCRLVCLQRRAPSADESGEADWHRISLGEGADLAPLMTGCDLVIHTAAKAGVWGSWDSYVIPNVRGTDEVLRGCRAAGVGALLFTSSPSVVFDGHDEVAIDESVPYPKQWLGHYSHTKALAEQAVLAASDLRVAALRPHLIWGSGDPHLIPRVVERGRRGRLRLVGDGGNRVDSTYIDNAVDAHLLAAADLLSTGRSSGRAFFISNGEPWSMRKLLDAILAAYDLPPVRRRVGPNLAYGIGVACEVLYRLLGLRHEPPLTAFVARQLATEHFFDITAAGHAFGYRPRIALDDGFRRLRAAR